jgi:hypothetical protein
MKLVSAEIKEPMCLFLVGMQCRSWKSMWKIPFILIRMRKIYGELLSNKDSGFLWGKFFTSNRPKTTLLLSYWKSSEHIERFISDKKFSHHQATKDYYKRLGQDPNIGIWHETYEINPGQAETLYYGMNPFGASGFLDVHSINRHKDNYMNRLRGRK